MLALTLWGGQKVKERQIKIYGFDRDSISDGVISSEDLESRIITLPDCFFVQAYECYSGKTLVDGDFIKGIIKVVLPKSEEDAKKEFIEGLKLLQEYNEVRNEEETLHCDYLYVQGIRDCFRLLKFLEIL